ncbi:hypothetical protein RRF57_007228 [Xylaria bambusicola]|uniref:NACHT domain-containing protein n=1 Tax=Xylaria bambusicola TaxID=326684 RepID=A0AAN7UUT1_9PEZI
MASVGIRWFILLVGGVIIAVYLWLHSRPAPSDSAPSPEGLSQVYPDPEDQRPTDIDIIAVHGLDTTSPDTWTWRAKRSLWTRRWSADLPQERDVNWITHPDMLPKATGERARIFTYNWPAKLFQKSIPTTLDQSAGVLLRDINRHLTETKDRPILFIASCLGGIILIKALEIDRHNIDPQRLVKSTRGIVFLATPFHGTSFKDMPGQLVNLWAWLQDQTVTALIGYTREPSPELNELVRRFLKLGDKDYHVFTFFEAVPTNLLRKVYLGWMVSKWIFLAWLIVLSSHWLRDSLSDWVEDFLPSWLRVYCSKKEKVANAHQLVDKNSATAQYFESRRLERRHAQMNKFRDNECNDYLRVAQTINDILGKIRTGTPLERADDWIRSKCYEKEKLKIQRLSDEYLSIDQCYINLAIVKQTGETRHCSKDGSEKGTEGNSLFSLSDRLRVGTPDEELQVELPTLFDPRKMPDGQVKKPRRVLIRGRAGIGKTTLCKKIVHDFTHAGMWNTSFDRVLWVRLRELKKLSESKYNLQDLFHCIYFEELPKYHCLAEGLLDASHFETSNDRGSLFLLDGLDEVSELLDQAHKASNLLKKLLNSPKVIITTRPHTTLPDDIGKLDIELETIGFYPNQVQEYLNNVVQIPLKVKEIQSFLQKHWLLQSLVRIPIQLDALCLTWDEVKDDPIPETMTGIYKAIVDRLWRKDTVRVGTKPEYFIKTALPSEIDVDIEEEFLGCLAFSGLYSNVIEFQPVHRDIIHKQFKERIKSRKADFTFDEWLGRLSFLRTSDPSADMSNRSYHFLHLTFQEYFAARYFVRQWEAGNDLEYLDLGSRKSELPISPKAFLRQYKYTARYDIVWRFTTGLLESKELSDFFEAIEQDPLDLLGPTHQRLIMHCLSEVGSSTELPIRSRLEAKLSQWLLFECDLTGFSSLARESECPDQALRAAMKHASSPMKMIILNELYSPGRHLSEAAAMDLVALLKDEDSDVREAAADALGSQSTLLEAAVTDLVALFKDEDSNSSSPLGLGRVQRPYRIGVTRLVASTQRTEDSDVREAAAWALGSQSTLLEAAVTDLVALLKDEDSNVRTAAAWALGLQPALLEAAVTDLVALLKDEDSNVREAAAEVLGKQSTLSEAAVIDLVVLLKNGDSDIQKAAATALARQPSLIALLKNENSSVRRAVAWALSTQSQLTLSKAAVTNLAALLEDKDDNIQIAAIKALGSQSALSKAAVMGLVALYEDSTIRILVASALGRQSIPLSEAAVTNLVIMLKNGDRIAQEVLAKMVALLKNKDRVAQEVLAKIVALLKARDSNIQNAPLKPWLEDIDSSTRSNAAWALSRQSALSKAVVTDLIALLKNENGDVRDGAVEALKHRSTLSEAAFTDLVVLLQNGDSGIQKAAATVLRNKSTLSEAAITSLIVLLQNGDSGVQKVAAVALGNQSTLSEAAVMELVALFKNENREVRGVAAIALAEQSTLSEAAVPGIIALLKDKDEDKDSYFRLATARALGNQSTLSQATVTELIALFKNENREVRGAAAIALAQQSTLSEATVTDLITLFKDKDSGREVRWAVAKALGQQSTLSEAAVAGLIAPLKDKDWDVRKAAAEDLWRYSTLSEKILEAIGLLQVSKRQSGTTSATLCNPQLVESLYGSLLYRSFKKPFSLYINADVGGGSCIINQPNGLRQACLDNSQILPALIKERQLWNIHDYDLWNRSEGENVQQ